MARLRCLLDLGASPAQEVIAALEAMGVDVVDAGTAVFVAGHFDVVITATHPHPGVHCDVLIDLTGRLDDPPSIAGKPPLRVHIQSDDLIGLLRWIDHRRSES